MQDLGCELEKLLVQLHPAFAGSLLMAEEEVLPHDEADRECSVV